MDWNHFPNQVVNSMLPLPRVPAAFLARLDGLHSPVPPHQEELRLLLTEALTSSQDDRCRSALVDGIQLRLCF